MPPPLPPKDITQLMQFIAGKVKNVTSPMNVKDLCRQFKSETGSVVAVNSLELRIERYRQKIHEMNEFDTETKVKMIFALSAPINAEFLIELKKVADVEVDEQLRIIHYKQKDGRLELSAKKHIRISTNVAEQRAKNIIQFLAEKAKIGNTPMTDQSLVTEFKEKTGCSDSINALKKRFKRLKNTIFELPGIDKNTKLKMMYISKAQLSEDILKELRQDADVEVDERGGITEYKTNDGSLELKEKKLYEKEQIDLVKFLVEKTKNATSPLRIEDLSKNFKKEFKVSGPWIRFTFRIRRIRPRIFNMNEFDMHTKIKMLFALSATIDDGLLQELQKDAIVELDNKQRIKKYEAKDGSLELEGDHSHSAKTKATWANKKKARVVDDSSDSDGDKDKKNIRKRGRKSSQTATSSSSVRRSKRIRSGMSGGIKRAKLVDSSSEESEDESSEEEDDDMELMKSEDDAPMDSDTSHIDNGGDDSDYDPPSYHQDSGDGINYDTPIHNKEEMKHALTESNSEVSSDKKEEEGPSSLAKIETMSLLDLLTHLRTPIVQYTPSLEQKLDIKIKGLEKKDQQISYDSIKKSLEMCIQILNTPDEMDSDENTTSLSDFFYRLGMVLLDIPHSSMDDFHVKMRKLATTGDKQIPMEHIRYAMKETLDKIMR